jgi:hypothetical protein
MWRVLWMILRKTERLMVCDSLLEADGRTVRSDVQSLAHHRDSSAFLDWLAPVMKPSWTYNKVSDI